MVTKDEFIAGNRFGYGVRFDQMEDMRGNPKIWLRRQLDIEKPPLIDMPYKSSADYVSEFHRLRQQNDKKKIKVFRKAAKEVMKETVPARIHQAVMSEHPFVERLASFWSNHFTVSIKGKPLVAGLIGAYENEAIRPNVLGRFEDMLFAVVQHPAMLMYLDNAQSIGPNSKAGRRNGKGLNENLAREILELHTLGVDGGYKQIDVTEFAKIITGWTISDSGEAQSFRFRHFVHEPGRKTLLGRTYRTGYDEGVRAIKDIARHPSTAKFIATKLARHFISDHPNVADVNTLARSFKNSGGDLAAVYKTLIDMPSVWRELTPKFKDPHDYIVSSMRVMGIKERKHVNKTVPSFALLNQTLYTAGSPAGWGDTERDWLTPDAVMNRLEWAHAVSQNIPTSYSEPIFSYMRDTMMPAIDFETLALIDNAPSVKEAIALILASTANQRR